MSSRIIVNGELAAGQATLEFIESAMDTLAKARRLKAQLASMAFGNPADYSQVAIELGLPDPAQVSSTAAQDAWTILMTAIDSLDVAQVRELARLDQ